MSNKKNNAPIVLRTTTFGNGKKIYRGQLIASGARARVIEISEVTEKEKEVKTKDFRTVYGKTLVIHPNYEGLKDPEIKKRVAAVEEYLKDHTTAQALEEVGKEVQKPNKDNPNGKEVIISWCPKIEKDLEFPIITAYIDKPRTEEVENISIETVYTYEEIARLEVYFNLKPRDFVRHCQNYLENQK
jgi:hypothetical protein